MNDTASTLVRVMVEMASRPMPEEPSLKQLYRIKGERRFFAALLCRDTGAHLLDSGGAYGRRFEANKERDFDSESALIVEIETWGDKPELNLTRPLYGVLVEQCRITKEAKALQRRLAAFAKAREWESWLETMEAFVAEAHEPTPDLESVYGVVNSYNHDTVVDQVVQYAIFGSGGQEYIALQAHNGCDVRGGYTEPWIFAVGCCGWSCFDNRFTDVFGQCAICSKDWQGENWYPDDTETEWVLDAAAQIVRHKGCGGTVEFS